MMDRDKLATRPEARGVTGVVSSGHLHASLAGLDILRRGGNAIDAGVAAGICLNVVHHDMCSFAGVAPIMIHLAGEGRTISIDGLGRWPQSVSLSYFYSQQRGRFQQNIAHCVVPAAADAWMTALATYGTMSFAEVSAAGIAHAQEGFPVHDTMAQNFRNGWHVISQTEGSRRVAGPHGTPLTTGELIVQPDLAATLTRLVEAERASTGDRRDRILAARDRFYRGDIAADFVAYSRANGGFFELTDFAGYRVREETPPSIDYRGWRVFACGPWSQGPALLQALQILKNFDLQSMGHNSADYIHTVVEALGLAFADREFYYGDPDFVDVPLQGLCDQAYAARRSTLIRPKRAWGELPCPGDPVSGRARRDDYRWPVAGDWETEGVTTDTTTLCVADRSDNLFAATLSDSFTAAFWPPIIPGLGLPLSGRGNQSRLDPNHPAVLAPGKRPRLTPNPVIVLRGGRPFIALGTPGGDTQPQSMLQFLLNTFEFGMTPQQAAEAPRFTTANMPDSFYPHRYSPGRIDLEGEIGADVADELQSRGHSVTRLPWRTYQAGSVCAAGFRLENGVLQGMADIRRESAAVAL